MVQGGGGAVQGDQEPLQEWRGRGAAGERGEREPDCGLGVAALGPWRPGEAASRGPRPAGAVVLDPCPPTPMAQADPSAAPRVLETLSHLPVPAPAPGAWQSPPLPSHPLPGPHVHAQCLAQGPLASGVPARPPEAPAHTCRTRVRPSDSAQPLEPPLAPLLGSQAGLHSLPLCTDRALCPDVHLRAPDPASPWRPSCSRPEMGRAASALSCSPQCSPLQAHTLCLSISPRMQRAGSVPGT